MSQSLKEINGKYYKEVEVVMLETGKAENAFYLQSNKLHYHKGYLTQDYLTNSLNAKSYHLYFLSREEIKVGDWISDGYQVWQWRDNSSLLGRKKVIATTDELVCRVINKALGVTQILPQPSHEFIQAYIEACNSGKPITKVLVEVEVLGMQTNETEFGRVSWIPMPGFDYTPKLKLKDNQIIIKKIEEEKYSYSEVKRLMSLAAWAFIGHNEEAIEQKDIDDYIKQNLKTK